MLRRDFAKMSVGLATAALFGGAERAESASTQFEFPHVAGLSDYVARFVTTTNYEDIPSGVLELGKKSILDGLGLALAGSKAETGALSRQYVENLGICNGRAVIAGSSARTAPHFAAFVNGVSIHADDFDDTQLSAAKDRVYGLLVHPTVPVLSAALALAGQKGLSGKELSLAYHLGVEVECKIAESIAPRHYQDGFHSTGTCGPFGSAAAGASLLHLDAKKTLSAFGIAASESGGLRENFGTMTKPFQAGHAAESGVVAADLASAGWTAAENILEAERGFFHAAGGSFDPSAILNRLGNPWTFASPGISLKPYPSGSLTHPAMSELIRLIKGNDIQPSQVEKVDIGANHNMTTTLLHHQPKTGLEAKFSMEFCLAILLLERNAGLSQFTDNVVRRSDVQQMIRRINFYIDPEAENAGFDKMTSILRIHLKDGRLISGRAEFAKGSPANPMTFEDVEAKFRGCAQYADWPQDKTDKIVVSVRNLEAISNVESLAVLLST